jgi:DNA repair protein RadC
MLARNSSINPHSLHHSPFILLLLAHNPIPQSIRVSTQAWFCAIIKILRIMEACKKQKFQVAEVELVYRSKVKASERPKINCSKDAYEILMDSWDIDKLELLEQFKVVFLNTACKVIGIYQVSSGGVAGTVADPKLIFTAALKIHANTIVLAHNHPSGNLKPSQMDEKLTEKIRKAGDLLEIKVLDHLIITSEGYYSFADEGVV